MASEAPIDFQKWKSAIFAGRYPEDVGLESVSADPEWILRYSAQLFRESAALLREFSERDLRVGFSALVIKWDLANHIWRQDVDWASRQDCIFAMKDVFDDLFTITPLGDTCHMWWDVLRSVEEDPDEKTVGAIFRICSELLRSENRDIQSSALHGLAHLDHPRRADEINAWLRSSKPADDDIREYAARAAAGSVL